LVPAPPIQAEPGQVQRAVLFRLPASRDTRRSLTPAENP
jgi:hypothetical protein